MNLNHRNIDKITFLCFKIIFVVIVSYAYVARLMVVFREICLILETLSSVDD